MFSAAAAMDKEHVRKGFEGNGGCYLKRAAGTGITTARVAVWSLSERSVRKMADKMVTEIPNFEKYHTGILGALGRADRDIYELLANEYERMLNSLQLIAAENLCSQAVLAALGSVVQNKTTEGFVGRRYHGGCEVVDQIETLAAIRAREAFGAKYANVQPHSGTSANQIILTAILNAGDRILSQGMDQGGHVSHGAKVSFGGKFFEVKQYCVDKTTFLLDYDAIRKQALRFKPKLIICGASAYCRTIDFAQFRRIADEVGAFLLADVSHIAGLIAAGAHPSPIDEAHFTTTSTYKPGGPRGGLILMGRDFDSPVTSGSKSVPLWKLIDKMTFPGVQGTPYLNNVAAKAVFFKETLTDEYRTRQFRIIENAKVLAKNLVGLDYDVLTGGTDNHMVMINISNSLKGLTGVIAQKSLEQCGIIVNMNWLPFDTKSPAVTSGVRLGTPIVTRNAMGPKEMQRTTLLFDQALKATKPTSDRDFELNEDTKEHISNEVKELCRQFPFTQY